MFNWLDIAAKQEQYQDLLRQADKQRLSNQALAGRYQNGQRLAGVLNWLSAWLV